MDDSHGTKTQKDRPTVTIAIVAVVILAALALHLYYGLDGLAKLGVFDTGALPPVASGGLLTEDGRGFVASSLELALGAAALVILVGFSLRYRWAWVSAMVWAAVSLLVCLVRYFEDDPRWWKMLAGAVLVLALNQRRLRQTYRIDTPTDDTAT